jgi:low temperature requirement protein LtrA
VSDLAHLVREPTVEERERKATYLELFFDLVFVFAFTQVTALVFDDPTVEGFLRAALVLALVWEAWSAYAWLTNAIDVENAVTRVLVFAAMAAVFFMALAIPDAFQDGAAWFAVAYFVVRVLNSALFLWGVRGNPAAFWSTLRLTPWFVGAAALVLVGGFVDSDYRAWLWLASLVVEMIGALVVARASGRAGRRRDVSPSHFAERYALIVIIALGESIIAIGFGTAGLGRDATFFVAVLIGLAGVAALWWEYFAFTAIALARFLSEAPASARSPLARDLFTFFHYPIVLGIVFYAVAAEKTLEHPTEPLSTPGRWSLGLGVLCFMAGLALIRLRAARRVAWVRLSVAVVALVVAVVPEDLDALVTLGIVVALLVVSVAVEAARLRTVRTELGHG